MNVYMQGHVLRAKFVQIYLFNSLANVKYAYVPIRPSYYYLPSNFVR